MRRVRNVFRIKSKRRHFSVADADTGRDHSKNRADASEAVLSHRARAVGAGVDEAKD